MSDRTLLPGKFVWFEHISQDAAKAQAFYGQVLGWKVKPFPMGGATYEMILTGDTWDTMIGGYPAPTSDRQQSHWISTVSVEDVDAAAKAAVTYGGKVVEAPSELPGVGRRARIADPQGAELGLLTDARGDKPDAPRKPEFRPEDHGRWCWNELHTSNPTTVLAFYEKVVGFSHRSLHTGPGGTYHILSRGGIDRGGVTKVGAQAHWLPYVAVGDVDQAIACARRFGARIPINPEDIPGVGRFAVLEDPTGALLALLRPRPMEK